MKKIAILVFRKEKSKGKYYTLAYNVVHMLEQLGYMPVLLPSISRHAEEILNQVDGLLIPGGPDICPSLYKQEISGAYQYCELQDTHSLQILDRAYKNGLPIFGICRGMQLINIYFGGTLMQHLEDTQKHYQLEKKSDIVHQVHLIRPESILAKSFHKSIVGVNSIHHQAIDRLGAGLIVTAVDSEDMSLIEAIENTQKTLMGVQWHPENLQEHFPMIQKFFN